MKVIMSCILRLVLLTAITFAFLIPSFSQYCNDYHQDYCKLPDFSFYYDKQSDDFSLMVGDSITKLIKAVENKDYYISVKAEGKDNYLRFRLTENNPSKTLLFDNILDVQCDTFVFSNYLKRNLSLTVTLLTKSTKKTGGKIFCMGILVANRQATEKPTPVEEPIAVLITPVVVETTQPVVETTTQPVITETAPSYEYENTYTPIAETSTSYSPSTNTSNYEPAASNTQTTYINTNTTQTSFENYSSRIIPGVVFTVQLAAVVAPLTLEQKKRVYHGPEDLVEKVEGIWYKYQVVLGSDYEEAKRFKLSCGVKGAFIVPYRDGTKIDIKSIIY